MTEEFRAPSDHLESLYFCAHRSTEISLVLMTSVRRILPSLQDHGAFPTVATRGTVLGPVREAGSDLLLYACPSEFSDRLSCMSGSEFLTGRYD